MLRGNKAVKSVLIWVEYIFVHSAGFYNLFQKEDLTFHHPC